MARIPKHFGLSYNEEIKMKKELDEVRKQVRQDFLKFKQALVARTSVGISHGLVYPGERVTSQTSEPPWREKGTVPTEVFGSQKDQRKGRSISSVSDSAKQTCDLRPQIQKRKSPPEESKVEVDRSGPSGLSRARDDPGGSERAKKPVIASLAGTTKQATLFKPSVRPQKLKHHRFIVRRRPQTPKPTVLQKIEEFPAGKSHTPPVQRTHPSEENATLSMTTESSAISISSRRESELGQLTKKKKQVKQDLKGAQRVSFAEERMGRIRGSKRISGRLSAELQGRARRRTLKIAKEDFQQSTPEEPVSSPSLLVKLVPRSIDEIIASLQSTSPSASDRMIKELIEGILGQNYDIKMEEAYSIRNIPFKLQEYQVKQETPADVEELQQIDMPKEAIDQTQGIVEAVQEDFLECSGEAEEPKLQDFSKPQTLDLLKPEENIPGPDGSQITGLLPSETQSSEFLQVKGVASVKSKPVAVPKKFPRKKSKIETVPPFYQWPPKPTRGIPQPSTFQTHHNLCIAAPRCVLPSDLQLASRVYHTVDRRGHDQILYSGKLDLEEEMVCYSKESDLNLEEEKVRVLHGVPVLGVKDDGKDFLPQMSKYPVEWKNVGEHNVEKHPSEQPDLQLCGEEIFLYPGAIKQFWTPAPPKFSAPIALMKETLFPEYESSYRDRLILGRFLSEFTIDDIFLMGQEKTKITERPLLKPRRHKSLLDVMTESLKLPGEKTEEYLHRAMSAPELVTPKDSAKLMIADDFESNMKVMKIQKQQINEPEPEEKPVESPPEQPALSKRFLQILQERQSSREPSSDKPESAEDLALVEAARKAGVNYIIFPKRRKRKSKKKISTEKLNAAYRTLSKPSRILKSSESISDQLGYRPHAISLHHRRTQSLPSALDFNQFIQVQGGIPKDNDVFSWVRSIWSDWFESTFPSITSSDEEKETPMTSVERFQPEEDKEPLQLTGELRDYSNPDLTEADVVALETEVNKLTEKIEGQRAPSAFYYCRRGAINRKLGRLKAAMDDLQEAIYLEPLLLNAYWHRHFIYLFQENVIEALNDLNYILKWNKNNAEVYLSKAEIFRNKGDITLAILNYTQALKCKPTDDNIYFKRGEMYEKGNKVLSIDDYSKCIFYNPRRTDALMKRGVYHFENSNWKAAIQDFTALLKIEPINSQARTYRGRAYIKCAQNREATEDFSAAIHLDPNNWLAFYHRGCLMRKSNPHKALQDFSVSVLINDGYENLGAFLHRGILYTYLKMWVLAICDFQSVLALDRGVSVAFINIGLIFFLHLSDNFEAIRQFSEAIKVDPQGIRSYICRAEAYNKMHNYKNAVRDISQAIHLCPDGIKLYILRGYYLYMMKNYELAKFTIYQIAQMNKGSFSWSPIQQSLVFSFCEDHAKAIEILRSVTLSKPIPTTFFLLGKAQMKAHMFQQAMETFKHSLKILTYSEKKKNSELMAAEIHFHLGLCYMEEACFEKAYDAFSKAVRVNPEYAEAFYQRGLCRLQLQKDSCVQDFNRAITIDSQHFQAYLSRAAFYGMKGRYSKAILNCNEAIRIHPESMRAFLYRGVLKYYNKTYKLAVEDLTKTINMNKNCFLAFYNRALCFHKMKEFQKALIDFGIVLLLDSGNDIIFKSLINRGLIYAELGKYAYAMEDFIEALQTNPTNVYLHQAIAICHHRMQDFEKAVDSFTCVLQLDPFYLNAYVGRGNSFLEYGHKDGNRQAQKDFLRALHLNPVCLEARISLGYNLQGQGKFQKAWNHFTIAMEINPTYHLAFEGRAVVCLQMGDNFAALQDINAGLKLTTTAELLTIRGVINQFMGFQHISMKDYQKAISLNPEYSLAYFNAANIYFHNRQFSQASDYYSKALQFDPENESAALNRAITNMLLNKTEDAKEDFERAIQLCPFSAAVYFNRAHLFCTLKQYDLAEEDLNTALSLQPNDALAYKLRSDVRGKMGLIKEAIADYKQALDLQEVSRPH
ncbi:LOW QUALITY PROTEIN: tetratricopeptide repeat protein 6 [Tachyglossus aculeatus]|uniref:LOW QUALITY PROTEIN: tetratricopeptide repeat protein 6 n=1 Tax=Tachyglossus aculeatus TaxID=9261 RepID=UPI0018F792C5|nr:LOW QUALITY PROTEIN: tetratricopeptide repeat protein 6 [Tachyglossus aculeatus]